MYDEETNRQVGETIATCNICGVLTVPRLNDRYNDKWGETWEALCPHLIRRLSDNNIGGFYDGKNLTKVI